MGLTGNVIEGIEFRDCRQRFLLRSARRKPARRFWQADVFCGVEDDVIRPDEDGDCLFFGERYDLRSSGEEIPVRVQIIHGTDKDTVLRQLDKIRAWLAEDWDWLIAPAELPADFAESYDGPF